VIPHPATILAFIAIVILLGTMTGWTLAQAGIL
jgi:hypothetical protein